MADLKERKTIVTAKNNILFAVVTGRGVDNYDKDGYIYKVAVELDKDEEKRIRKEAKAFWNANKSKDQGDEPANWENITYKDKEGNRAISAQTKVEINGDPVVVGLVDGQRNKLDPKVYGSIGKGSTGAISITMKIYQSGRKEGVSLFLNAVQLGTFVPYSGGGGDHSGDFGETDDEAIAQDDGFKGNDDEPKVKKDKKKKKKNKDK